MESMTTDTQRSNISRIFCVEWCLMDMVHVLPYFTDGYKSALVSMCGHIDEMCIAVWPMLIGTYHPPADDEREPDSTCSATIGQRERSKDE